VEHHGWWLAHLRRRLGKSGRDASGTSGRKVSTAGKKKKQDVRGAILLRALAPALGCKGLPQGEVLKAARMPAARLYGGGGVREVAYARIINECEETGEHELLRKD